MNGSIPTLTVNDRVTHRPVLLTGADVDRATCRRLDQAWLAETWQRPDTRVLVVAAGEVLVAGEEPAVHLLLLPPGELTGSNHSPDRYFLGADPSGASYFALPAATLPDLPDPTLRAAGLWEVGALLSLRDAGLMVQAVALESWHRRNRFCARCGGPTAPALAGHARRCSACSAEHFPRTDPAVIVLVTDEHDRVLLGHQERWPSGRYSVLAGFVEPGESLEEAAVREVAEETGVRITDLSYVASQPWPFPSSLMLGFTARAWSTDIQVDGEEIAEARWFTRAELRACMVSGQVLPPNRVSIAAHLIEGWYGGPLPVPGIAP